MHIFIDIDILRHWPSGTAKKDLLRWFQDLFLSLVEHGNGRNLMLPISVWIPKTSLGTQCQTATVDDYVSGKMCTMTMNYEMVT